MKFSIIVPVYNAEGYIDKLIKSVQQQTFQEYELILVDDSSEDNSYSIIKEYQKADNRIKAYTKTNTGPGMTRKYGFEKANGDLLFFVDADDWITKEDTLERINDIFESNPNIDVLFFDRESIVGDKKDIINGFKELGEGIHRIDEIREAIRPGLGAKIFKRDMLSSEMFYDSTIFEDLYTTYAYLEKCDRFYYCPSCFYSIYHDKNSDSLSSAETAEQYSKSLDIILNIYYRTKRPSLRYSLELRMATLFIRYYKRALKNIKECFNKTEKNNVKRIVEILKDNNVVIKPDGNPEIKIIIYKMLLLFNR